MNMEFYRKLPIPKEIKEEYPLSKESEVSLASRKAEIKKIFSGESDKFALIIGPCSADREDAVLDYISRLRKVQEKVQDKIIIIPRLYMVKGSRGGKMDVKVGERFGHTACESSIGRNKDDRIRSKKYLLAVFFEKCPFFSVPIQPPAVGIDICVVPEVDPFHIVKTAYSDIKKAFSSVFIRENSVF